MRSSALFLLEPRVHPRPAEHVNDDDLRRAQRGDVDAFGAVYRAHAGRVYAICRRMCGDPARAEELTQDAFVLLWQKLPLFRGESAFESWMYRLVCNCVLQSMRSERRGRAHLESIAGLPDECSLGRSAGSDIRIDLESAIAALPPGARTVFVLHDVLGYRHDEIARLTGRATGTLRSQLHRARQLLMEALG